MKLSEAILKGCENTKQIKKSFSNGNGACALGAAILGAGSDLSKRFTAIWDLFPYSKMKLKEFPSELMPPKSTYVSRGMMLFRAIYLLNDMDGWSREAIAMWVSTLEDYLESQEQEEPAKDNTEEKVLV